MVEVARLESVYRFIAYPGFESPSLRQEQEKWPPLRVAIFFVLDGESGIRRAGRTRPALSESSVCHRCAVARREAPARSALLVPLRHSHHASAPTRADRRKVIPYAAKCLSLA